jgi:hypothetical protein
VRNVVNDDAAIHVSQRKTLTETAHASVLSAHPRLCSSGADEVTVEMMPGTRTIKSTFRKIDRKPSEACFLELGIHL